MLALGAQNRSISTGWPRSAYDERSQVYGRMRVVDVAKRRSFTAQTIIPDSLALLQYISSPCPSFCNPVEEVFDTVRAGRGDLQNSPASIFAYMCVLVWY